MSKEQTPITAEEFLDKDEFVNVKGFIKESGTLKTTTSLMEQYAQAKVLEALEPIIQECKKVIDSPNHLESTKGFASIIWHELEQSKQK